MENEKGVRYQLVKCGTFCELDLVEKSAELVVNDTSARASSEVGNDTTELIELAIESSQPVTLEARTEKIRRLQADVQRGKFSRLSNNGKKLKAKKYLKQSLTSLIFSQAKMK